MRLRDFRRLSKEEQQKLLGRPITPTDAQRLRAAARECSPIVTQALTAIVPETLGVTVIED